MATIVRRRSLFVVLFFVLPFRFLTGRPMSGKDKTDCTFLYPATKSLHASGRATRWALMAGYQRVLWRLAGVSALFLYAAQRAVFYVALTAVAGYAGWRVYHWYRVREHMRTVVRPLHVSAGPLAGIPKSAQPGEWLHVPLNHATDDEALVRVTLPAEYNAAGGARKEFANFVASKVPGEWDASWNMQGAPVLTLAKPPKPPERVNFELLHPYMLKTSESAPIIGLGVRDKPISADLDSDSPHVLVSAGSGGGKSVTVRTLACQLLHNGARLIILDITKHGMSHRWAKGLPGVKICRTPEEAHNTLIELRAEMDARYEALDEDESIAFQRVVIVCEEMNATINRMTSYWLDIKKQNEPKTSPAIQGLADILFAGRQTRMNVIAVAQMMTARTIGGPEARENFAVRIMARYTTNAWKMLAPEVWPAPRSSRKPGRVQIVMGGEAFETQVAFFTDAEAIAWATSGIPQPGTQEAVTVTGTMPDQGTGTVTVTPVAPVLTIVSERFTLPEIARRKTVPMSYDALRQAKRRDPEFPPAVMQKGQDTWTEPDLKAWYANRESVAAATEKEA
jgi:hypothetical protein